MTTSLQELSKDAFLNDPCIQKNIKALAEATKPEYVYKLRQYFTWLWNIKNKKLTPEQLFKEHCFNVFGTAPDDIKTKQSHSDLTQEYCGIEGIFKDAQNATRQHILTVIKSFYTSNGCPLIGKINIGNNPKRGKRKTFAINNADVIKLFNALPLRHQALYAWLIYTGQRINEAVATIYADVEKGLKNNDDPIQVSMLNKKGTRAIGYIPEYWTYCGGYGLKVLKAYIKNVDVEFKSSTILFLLRNGSQITSTYFNRILRNNAIRIGLSEPNNGDLSWRQNFHPHALRKVFATEAKTSGVSPDFKEFFMGHQGGIERIYDRTNELYEDQYRLEYLKFQNRMDSFFNDQAKINLA